MNINTNEKKRVFKKRSRERETVHKYLWLIILVIAVIVLCVTEIIIEHKLFNFVFEGGNAAVMWYMSGNVIP